MATKASRRAPRNKAGAAPAAVRVAIGLGSNRCHGRHGRPPAVLRAAVARLAESGLADLRLSRIRETAPLGPRQRRFANAVAIASWEGDGESLLALLKRTEREFGRRSARRWGPRVLDLDLIAVGDAVITRPGLEVPHPGLPFRDFVLRPLLELWAEWRHPVLNLPARVLAARLAKPRAIDPPGPGS